MRKTDWEQTRDAFRSLSPGRTRPPSAVCVARAGSVWQGLNCLGPTVWELSRASPAWLRWMLPSSSAAVFFPCACLAEHSHVAEGERGDGRNRALMLPWQTALATWLLEPLFLVSGSSQGSVVPRTLGKALPWFLSTAYDWPRSQATATPGQNICRPTLHNLQNRFLGMAFKASNAYLSNYSSNTV